MCYGFQAAAVLYNLLLIECYDLVIPPNLNINFHYFYIMARV